MALQRGANPNVCDAIGETPLFDAVASGDSDVVAALLLQRADPLVKSLSGQAASEMADEESVLALLHLFEGVVNASTQETGAFFFSELFVVFIWDPTENAEHDRNNFVGSIVDWALRDYTRL